MIETIPYAVGFVIYVLFCLITFEVYSKNEGMTQAPILFFIYFYYSFLAWYLIDLVETSEPWWAIFIQTIVYIVACGLLLWNYYKKQIKPHDDSLYGQNV